MYTSTGCHLKQNGNMPPEEVLTFRCIHGADHIPGITKVASSLTLNRCVVIISTMETYMQEKLDHTNQMNMDYMICQETFLSGHVALTRLQLTSSSTTSSQTTSIMPNLRTPLL